MLVHSRHKRGSRDRPESRPQEETSNQRRDVRGDVPGQARDPGYTIRLICAALNGIIREFREGVIEILTCKRQFVP